MQYQGPRTLHYELCRFKDFVLSTLTHSDVKRVRWRGRLSHFLSSVLSLSPCHTLLASSPFSSLHPTTAANRTAHPNFQHHLPPGCRYKSPTPFLLVSLRYDDDTRRGCAAELTRHQIEVVVAAAHLRNTATRHGRVGIHHCRKVNLARLVVSSSLPRVDDQQPSELSLTSHLESGLQCLP